MINGWWGIGGSKKQFAWFFLGSGWGFVAHRRLWFGLERVPGGLWRRAAVTGNHLDSRISARRGIRSPIGLRRGVLGLDLLHAEI